MQRRDEILQRLQQSRGSVTGADLARQLGVSRQVIVQDVAILRAEGHGILATPQGYVMVPESDPAPAPHRARIAVNHPPQRTREELNVFVDCGVRVVDVIVEHALYGDLTGVLMLKSRDDVSRFMTRMEDAEAALLSSLTEGVHLHTVEFDRVDDLKHAEDELRKRGLLAGDQ